MSLHKGHCYFVQPSGHRGHLFFLMLIKGSFKTRLHILLPPSVLPSCTPSFRWNFQCLTCSPQFFFILSLFLEFPDSVVSSLLYHRPSSPLFIGCEVGWVGLCTSGGECQETETVVCACCSLHAMTSFPLSICFSLKGRK